jgi:hypothetical protein
MATNEAYMRGWKLPLTVGASVPARSPVLVGAALTGISLTKTAATGTTSATVLRHGVVDLAVKGLTDAVKLTFASVTNSQTIIFNGLTFTANTDTTTKATRTFSIAGTNAEDVTEFLSCVNDATHGAPGVTGVDAGSGVCYLVSDATISAITGTASGATVTVDHDVTYTSDVDEGDELFISGSDNTSRVISKQPSGVHFGWACDTVTDAKLTFSTVTNGQTIVIQGVTFTAHTNTTTRATRNFSIAGTDTQDAAALAGLINDAVYGIRSIVATASNGVITLASDDAITVTGTAVDGATCIVEAGTRTIPVKLGY